MEKLLFDWINPLDGLMGRLVHGSMHRFTFCGTSDFSGYEVEQLMHQYGIRIWGRETNSPEELAFLVKHTQAVWAEYILCRAGVPLTCSLLDPRNAQYIERHERGSMPEPWIEEGIGPIGFVDYAVDWIARLLR